MKSLNVATLLWINEAPTASQLLYFGTEALLLGAFLDD